LSAELKREPPGPHVFRVRAVDSSGDEDFTPAKQRFKVVQR
jgi:hypothetical protein